MVWNRVSEQASSFNHVFVSLHLSVLTRYTDYSDMSFLMPVLAFFNLKAVTDLKCHLVQAY